MPSEPNRPNEQPETQENQSLPLFRDENGRKINDDKHLVYASVNREIRKSAKSALKTLGSAYIEAQNLQFKEVIEIQYRNRTLAKNAAKALRQIILSKNNQQCKIAGTKKDRGFTQPNKTIISVDLEIFLCREPDLVDLMEQGAIQTDDPVTFNRRIKNLCSWYKLVFSKRDILRINIDFSRTTEHEKFQKLIIAANKGAFDFLERLLNAASEKKPRILSKPRKIHSVIFHSNETVSIDRVKRNLNSAKSAALISLYKFQGKRFSPKEFVETYQPDIIGRSWSGNYPGTFNKAIKTLRNILPDLCIDIPITNKREFHGVKFKTEISDSELFQWLLTLREN